MGKTGHKSNRVILASMAEPFFTQSWGWCNDNLSFFALVCFVSGAAVCKWAFYYWWRSHPHYYGLFLQDETARMLSLRAITRNASRSPYKLMGIEESKPSV